MNETGTNYLNQLISSGRAVMMSITARELEEYIYTYTLIRTGVKLPFEIEADMETGKAYMELELDEISERDNELMVNVFKTSLEEFYVLTDVILEELFGPGACAYLSEVAEAELMDEESAPEYYFTLHLDSPDIRFNVPNQDGFGQVEWQIEDIIEEIEERGLKPKTALIDAVMDCSHFEKTLQERMLERGWAVISDVVEEISSGFKAKEDRLESFKFKAIETLEDFEKWLLERDTLVLHDMSDVYIEIFDETIFVSPYVSDDDCAENDYGMTREFQLDLEKFNPKDIIEICERLNVKLDDDGTLDHLKA